MKDLKKFKKHENIIRDYEKIKSKHLEKLASNILKKDEKNEKLKNKSMNKDFLDLF